MENLNTTDCPYYLISRAYLVITSALKKGFALADVGQMKPAYIGVLLNLWNEDGVKMVELGRKAGLEPSTMSGLLDRMTKDKLIERVAAKNDRRAQLIFLTESGKNIQKPVLDAIDQVLADVFGDIPENDIAVSKHFLRQILANSHKKIT